MYKNHSEKGQILLIVVITMIVALTVGLTVASRTVTELKLSKQNEESQRAFNAAEAGIDKVLQRIDRAPLDAEIEIANDLVNNSNFSVSTVKYAGPQIILNNGDEVDQDVGADVWLSNHPDFSGQLDGYLTIYWGNEDQTSCSEDAPVRPALEVVLLQGDILIPSALEITKYLYDTCDGRKSGDLDVAFSGVYDDILGLPGETFSNVIDIPIQFTDGIIMKIIPLYNSTKVAVVTQDSLLLPSQGTIVVSTGTSGDTIRRITYYQSFPQMPIEVFPYNIISQ